MRWELGVCEVRLLQDADAAGFARHMNDRAVWQNLRDGVPHPYTLDDAREFIAQAERREPPSIWAIEIDGDAVGGIGLHPKDDVYRRTVEIGFWLGRAYHGRGIMSAVVPVVARHAFDLFPEVCRVQGEVFAWNPASMRVLEKAGFVREGLLRDAVTKDGRTGDLAMYALRALGSG